MLLCFVLAVIAVYFLLLEKRPLENCRWLYLEDFEQKQDLFALFPGIYWPVSDYGVVGIPPPLKEHFSLSK